MPPWSVPVVSELSTGGSNAACCDRTPDRARAAGQGTVREDGASWTTIPIPFGHLSAPRELMTTQADAARSAAVKEATWNESPICRRTRWGSRVVRRRRPSRNGQVIAPNYNSDAPPPGPPPQMAGLYVPPPQRIDAKLNAPETNRLGGNAPWGCRRPLVKVQEAGAVSAMYQSGAQQPVQTGVAASELTARSACSVIRKATETWADQGFFGLGGRRPRVQVPPPRLRQVRRPPFEPFTGERSRARSHPRDAGPPGGRADGVR
jgi:hypothetical protein